jgi:flagellar biosynthetic protein FlhB
MAAALAILGAVTCLGWHSPAWFQQWRLWFSELVQGAYAGNLGDWRTVVLKAAAIAFSGAAAPLALAWSLAVLASLVQGGFVFAGQAILPRWERLNPANNLGRIFSLASLSSVLKSTIPMLIITYLGAGIVRREWGRIFHAAHPSPAISFPWLMSRLLEIAWKAGLVFLLWSLADYFLERMRFERQLRMSREEIREEIKETEGNPQIKARIKRLQRQLRRRFMLKEVRRATVVVTNPTEYAVALEYRLDAMPAPVVVAKGRNLLARQIRQEAVWHGVPIVENPPLAQTLYRLAEVGQAIPAKLYVAVAEILAFIYRTQGRVRGSPGRQYATAGPPAQS